MKRMNKNQENKMNKLITKLLISLTKINYPPSPNTQISKRKH